MSGLFAFLLLLSILSLLIGLIKPSIFNRLFKKEMTRKKVATIFGVASFVLFFVTGLTADDVPTTNRQNKEIAQNNIAVEQNENEIVEDNTEQENQDTEKSEEENNDQPADEPSDNNSIYYQVIEVVDGDTVKVNIDGTIETLRLIGIDTPETVHPSKPVECFGIEASNKAKSTLNNKRVSLESDPTQGDRDKYSRLLRYVILEDGTNFNKMMISQGYAYEYTYSTPYKYQSEFKQAQSNAQNSKLGLWADGVCEDETPPAEEPNPPADEQSDGYKWYVSSHWSSKQYYCETDDGWKSLSEKYLKVYDSEAALLADFPSHTLHEPGQ